MWRVRVKWKQAKMEGTCYKLLPVVAKEIASSNCKNI